MSGLRTVVVSVVVVGALAIVGCSKSASNNTSNNTSSNTSNNTSNNTSSNTNGSEAVAGAQAEARPDQDRNEPAKLATARIRVIGMT